MGESKILVGSTQTLLSYPRVSTGGGLVKAQPTSVTVRIATPSTAMPAEASAESATVDTTSATTSAAAAVGATSLSFGSYSVVSDSESGLLSDVTSPQTICTTTLAANRTYTVAITFTLTLDNNEGGGPTLDVAVGSIAATVTTDSSSITVVSQTPTYSTPGSLMTTVDISSSGLDMLTRVSGDINGTDITRSVSVTATPSSLSLVRGRRYLVLEDDVLDVECAQASGTATTMRLAEPLPRAVDSGTSVVGFAVSHALTAAETSDPGEGLAIWRAVIGGVTYQWSQAFQIVRRMPVWVLTPGRLTQKWPIVHTLKSRQDDSLEELIEAAGDDDVLELLALRGVKLEDTISWDALESFHALACLQRLCVTNARVDAGVKADIKARYDEVRRSLLTRSDWWTQAQNELPAPRPADVPAIDLGQMVTR